MTGKIVYVDGSFPASGNVKLDLSTSDQYAARIAGLRVAFTPAGLNAGTGFLRNVANGKEATMIGMPTVASEAAFNGKRAFNFEETDRVRAEAGSADHDSFAFVICAAFSADDLAGTGILFYRSDSEGEGSGDIRNYTARYLGTVGAPGLNLNFVGTGTAGNVIIPEAYFEADVPFVVMGSYDATTQTGKVWFNGELIEEKVFASAYAAAPEDTWDMGYPTASGLSGSKVARAYVYEGDVAGSPYGEAQLMQLSAALTAEFA